MSKENAGSKQDQGNSAWDHGSNQEFYEYYIDKSQSNATRTRSLALYDVIINTIRERSPTPLEVADIGCNVGAQCQIWAEKGHRVRGLDVNGPLIEEARKRATENDYDIQFEVGTAVSLPWPDSCVDVCLVPELLEHVVEWEACLDEFTRILKPGGVLYISTSNKLCPVQEEFNLPLYSWYPDRLKKHYESLAVSTRPEIANHAKYPAVNWFTFYSLRDALRERGLYAKDRFALIDLSRKNHIQRLLVNLIKCTPPLRWLGHVATPYTVLLAFKQK